MTRQSRNVSFALRNIECFDTPTAARDSTLMSRLNLAIERQKAGHVHEARLEMQALAQADKGWDEPVFRLADSHRAEGDDSRAGERYRDCLMRNPRHHDALLGLAATQLRIGNILAAQTTLLRCCRLHRASSAAWDLLGLAFGSSQDCAEAERAYSRAQALAPQDMAIALRRVDAAIAAGTADTELIRLEQATEADALDIVLLTARGVLLDRLGRRDEAIDILEAASIIAPAASQPALELANALLHVDRNKEAERALTAAIALLPDQWLLRNNRAVILLRLLRYHDARREIEDLIATQGERVGLLCNLATALTALGEQDAGLAAATRATEVAPDQHLPWRTVINSLAYTPGVTAQAMLDAGRRAAAALRHEGKAPLVRDLDRNRRLRIGLLSTQLKTHPVGWLTLAGFEHLDPRAFELICIGTPETGDPMSKRFRAIASEWHPTPDPDPERAAAEIRDLNLDILIDLSGYGDRGLMALCAFRCAPVQIKWVGMQNHSTGMPEIDWFIADRWEVPVGLEAYYSERLLHLPDGYVCYSPPSYAPTVAPLPALRNGFVTFGCFNNLSKITPAVIATWSEILRRVPDARLLLKTHQFGDPFTAGALHQAFESAGIARSRIELRGGSPHRALLAEYGDVDFVLDPFPYTGGLTTCEALWMGVPTLTLAGETFSSRHAASHLSNVGLPDWITTDRASYCDEAVRRSSGIHALAALRNGLRSRVKDSPLCDAPRFAAGLSDAFRRAWRDHCSSHTS